MLWFGNKICEKELGFFYKNIYNICYVINMYICKDINVIVGYCNWLEIWIFRCDVCVYYLYWVKIEREKVFISDFMINLSLYIRDSFLEIR